jgi:hypothetical protein
LRHPHIVPLFETGTEPSLYLASAFIEGRSLAEVLCDGPLPFPDAAGVVRDLAEALAYAHEQGIVHRDVKSANVILDAGGQAHLLDFGLAYRREEESKLTKAGDLLGTPAYMAPELVTDPEGGARPAADQYALGVVLYELLTGQTPFDGPAEVVLFQAIHSPAPRPGKTRAGVPRDLETICLKALAKRPEDRYGGCQEFADDLRRFLEGEPVTARRPAMVERLARWIRRNPAVAGLTAAVAMTLAVGICVATTFALRASANAERADQEAFRAIEEAGRANAATAKAIEEADRANRGEKQAKLEAHRANVSRHGFQMTAAWQAWQQHDPLTVESLLDGVPSMFRRTWEYRHVRGLQRRTMMLMRGHTWFVNSVAISLDGRRIVSGSKDKTVRVWDIATGQNVLTLTGHADEVNSVAISPDARRIVSGSSDRSVKVWDIRTGQNLFTFNEHVNAITSVAISPDGNRIVGGGEDTVTV